MTAAEKMEVIRLVEGSSLSVKRTLAEPAIPRSTFYRRYCAYARSGYAGLEAGNTERRHWNRIVSFSVKWTTPTKTLFASI